MFIGRTQELERLNGLYASERSGIMVLYGRNGIGKTALVRRFMQGKTAVYYAARRVTTEEQLLCMKREWKTEEATGFYEVLTSLYDAKYDGGKLVLVFDEFRNLLEDSPEFLEAFLRFYAEHHGDGSLLVMLVSSGISWVENEMTAVLGSAARLLNGFIKLKEFSFMELAGYHKDSTVRDNIYTQAVLGGVPGYLRQWREKDSFKDNVMRLFLSEEAPFFGKPVLVLRDKTERPEGIETGGLWLVGTDGDAIRAAVSRLLREPTLYRRMMSAKSPYGDGFAARRIADILESLP